jgi:hypothetical protein
VIKNTVSLNGSYSRRNYRYAVNLKLQRHAPKVHCEPVLPADLTEIYSEAWLAAYLRKGHPEVGFNDLTFRLWPQFVTDSTHRCRQVIIESKPSSGKALFSPKGVEVLRAVAERGAQRLIEAELLDFGQPYYYEVVAEEHAAADPVDEQAASEPYGSPQIKYRPINYREVGISSLLKGATAVGAAHKGLPIFVNRSTYRKAEQSARNGARTDPPVESGAVVLGWLGSCPETGEFFVVATDVIELVEALQKENSLTYTDKTWAHIQTVLRHRRLNPQTSAERIVGQCHGHNFPPCSGDQECDHCAERNACKATSVFVSESDLLWSRCVFSRQPWAFCQIFGLDARGGPVHRMYGFRKGRLKARGFYLI